MTDLKILYVDDERANRVVFEQAFRTKFRIEAVENGELALAALDRGDVAVLVTDQRMPGMSGHELLEKARAKHPEVLRIIITAYNDIDPILRAVNEGLVSRYVVKPWDRAELDQILTWAAQEATMTRVDATLQLQLLRAERSSTLEAVAALLRDGAAAALQVALARVAAPVPAGISEPLSVMRYAVAVCQSQARANRTHIVCAGDATLPKIALGAVELAQVLIALIENAMAAANGGRVTVEATRVADAVEFVVSDNGAGMSPEVLAEAGAALFSTRAQAAGLGLAQCRRILDAVGARLTFDSAVGAGTRVRFPVGLAP